jgi:hypothetical protein
MSKTTRRDALKAATLAGLAGVTAGLPEVARGQLQDQTKPGWQVWYAKTPSVLYWA